MHTLDIHARAKTMDNNDKKTSKVEEKEKCVICGRYTDECVSTPITLRRFYVEGAGQV